MVNVKAHIFFVPLFVWATLISCQVVKDADQASNPRGGRCNLSRNGMGNVLCFDYVDGYDANTASAECDTFFNSTYTSISLNGRDWMSGDGNACSTGSLAGSCNTTRGTMYYYNNQWNGGSANTDCTTTLSGTFVP